MASIRQRPDGKWRARYRDDDGREHSKHFDRKRDGQAWLDEIAAARRTGTYVDPQRSTITLAGFYGDWADRQVWAVGTRTAADRAVEACDFGAVPFAKLRRSHAEAWVKAMQANLAASTIRTRVKYVRGALRAAVHDRLLSEDPTAGLKLPAVRKTEHTMRIPTPREVNAIRDRAEPFLRPLLDVMAYAGLRIGEAAAVQVSDVDWLRRTVHVARQVQNRPGTREVCPPKHGSERVVPVPSALTERLSAAMRDVGVFGSAQWFLPGDPPSPNALRRWFEKACTAAGVDGITPHDFRHFYASGLIRSGLDAVSVARAMGHASPAITLAIYAHLFPDAADRTRAAAADLMASTADSADDLRTEREA
ncbi:site-specific integrase [Curtobacterium citreum]|uniref:Site-specific integrase n=2 Tax=Curtobacterium citreum TaxID=2036 RepID=A0ABT2HDN3_9MICO|nr:site-specific integrase [Curtobacterium citreum]MCS6521368.1 site-specific integrase [Curtobacterium citreum]TQJ28227.1 site-specific recombinase XerD [Curtobacterium citreum]GGL76805.1 site-specific integrase [Curtobacterium citreum]